MSDKKTYRVRNWKDDNKALVQRGSLTLWICEDVLEKWRSSAKSGKRGLPETYPNEVISCAGRLFGQLNRMINAGPQNSPLQHLF